MQFIINIALSTAVTLTWWGAGYWFLRARRKRKRRA